MKQKGIERFPFILLHLPDNILENTVSHRVIFQNLPLPSPTEKVKFFFTHFPQGSTSSWSVPGRQQGVTIISYIMPKVKTNSSAKKRFKVTGTGLVTYQKPFKRHILTKKSKKRKRSMRIDGVVDKTQTRFVLRLLRLKG